MAYSDKVIDHYNNPRNVGQLDKGSTEVGTGLVGAPECGDVMRLQIRVNPETQVIEEAKFKTFGCGSAIASSSLATGHCEGIVAAAGEDPLFGAGRGCDSRGHWRLEEEERRCGSGGSRGCRAVRERDLSSL
jgi:hypothetical protein